MIDVLFYLCAVVGFVVLAPMVIIAVRCGLMALGDYFGKDW